MLKSHPRSLQCFPGLTGDSPFNRLQLRAETRRSGAASGAAWSVFTSHFQYSFQNCVVVSCAFFTTLWAAEMPHAAKNEAALKTAVERSLCGVYRVCPA